MGPFMWVRTPGQVSRGHPGCQEDRSPVWRSLVERVAWLFQLPDVSCLPWPAVPSSTFEAGTGGRSLPLGHSALLPWSFSDFNLHLGLCLPHIEGPGLPGPPRKMSLSVLRSAGWWPSLHL